MAVENFTPQRSIAVESDIMEEIQGIKTLRGKLPHIERLLPEKIPASLGDSEGDLHTNSILSRPTLGHARSYLLNISGLDFIETINDLAEVEEQSKAFFQDEYGNLFMDVNTKGNNLSDPMVYRYPVSPSKLAFFGLQDGDSLARILKASDLLRHAGVDTELILQVHKLKKIPYKGDILSLDDYKEKLLADIYAANAKPKTKGSVPGSTLLTRKNIPEVAQSLVGMDFYVTVRGVQAAERLSDLLNCQTREDFLKIVGKAIRFANYRNIRNIDPDTMASDKLYFLPEYTDDPEGEVTHSDQDTVIRDYFMNYLSKQIGRNYGLMHSAGLRHVFAHNGNISTTGGIYDLDSVKGKPLEMGDKKVSEKKFQDEIRSVLKNSDDLIKAVMRQHVGTHDMTTQFAENVIEEYVRARGKSDDFNYISTIYASMFEKYSQPYENALRRITQEILLSTMNKDTTRDKDDAFVNMFKSFGPEFLQIAIDISIEENSKNKGGNKKDRKEFTQIALDIVRKAGLEEDIIGNIGLISEIWQDFSDSSDEEIETYFADLVLKTLGWDLSFPNTVQQLSELAVKSQEQDLNRSLELAILRAPINSERKEVIENALLNYWASLDTFDWIVGNETIGWVLPQIEKKYPEDVSKLRSLCSQEGFDAIFRILEDKLRFDTKLTPKEIEDGEQLLRANQEELASPYYQRVGYDFDVIPYLYAISMDKDISFEPGGKGNRLLDKALQDIGFHYSFDNLDSLLEMVSTQVKTETLQRFIEIMKADPQGDRLEQFRQAFNQITQLETKPDHLSIFIIWSDDFIFRDILNRFGDRYKQLVEKYGKGQFDALLQMIVRREMFNLHESPQEQKDKMSNLIPNIYTELELMISQKLEINP